jgi:hypothetical protein
MQLGRGMSLHYYAVYVSGAAAVQNFNARTRFASLKALHAIMRYLQSEQCTA